MKRTRRRRRIVIAVAGAVLLVGIPVLLAVAALGCAMHVRSAAELADPVPVFVIDYGYHSSLLLPRPSGEVAEYAYGEWKWFALGQNAWYRLAPVLCWPTRGTLGNRVLSGPPELDNMRAQTGMQSIYELHAEQRRVEALLAELDRRFERHHAEMVINEASQLWFVPDDRPYSLARQCNSEVGEWLEDLGCETRGRPLLARFEIE